MRLIIVSVVVITLFSSALGEYEYHVLSCSHNTFKKTGIRISSGHDDDQQKRSSKFPPGFNPTSIRLPLTTQVPKIGYVYVVVMNGTAYDYSPDSERVDIFVHSNDVVIKSSSFGTLSSDNLTGPYVVHSNPFNILVMRDFLKEDQEYIDALAADGTKPNNFHHLDTDDGDGDDEVDHNQRSGQKKDKKQVDKSDHHDEKSQKNGVDDDVDTSHGNKNEDREMRRQLHHQLLRKLTLETDYWRKLYEFEFGPYHHDSNSDGDDEKSSHTDDDSDDGKKKEENGKKNHERRRGSKQDDHHDPKSRGNSLHDSNPSFYFGL